MRNPRPLSRVRNRRCHRAERMKRRLLNVLTVLSLLLLVAVPAWWARSHWVSETIGRVGESKVVVLRSGGGSLVLTVSGADPENEEPGPRPYYVWHRSAAMGPAAILDKGKVVRFGADIRLSGFGWAVVPHWLLILATLPGGWWSLVQVRRSILAKVRRNYGHCPACGYELRATPGRCPECGEPVALIAGGRG